MYLGNPKEKQNKSTLLDLKNFVVECFKGLTRENERRDTSFPTKEKRKGSYFI